METAYVPGEGLYNTGRAVIDEEFRTLSGNQQFFSYFGSDISDSIRRAVDGEDLPRLTECVENAVSGYTLRTVVRMKGVGGELRWMLVSVSRLSGDKPMFALEFYDVFSLEMLSASRERTLSEYRYILSLVSDIAFEYSFETRHIRIYMFDCCREIVLADEELEKWQNRAISSGWVQSRYIEIFNILCRDIKNGAYRFDYEFESSLLTQGKAKEMCLFRGLTRYDDPKTRKVSGIISVVSSRHKSKDVNPVLEANKDSLSGLLNKRTVISFAKESLRAVTTGNVNLVILDIDDFTDINSSYGHLFGDEIICTIAGIIKRELGTRGVAGRISGGGFLLVLENSRDEEELRGILLAIQTNIELAFAGRFENFRLTCSVGASTYPVDSRDYDELFMQADKALYIAKTIGHDRFVIYDVNKHGPVEMDIEKKIAYLSSNKSATEKLSFAADLAESLVFGRIPDISVLLEQIRTEFRIDDICVFSGNDMSLILSCGNASSRNAAYLLENGYTERFSGDGIFAVDNVNELKGREDRAFEQLSEEHIGAAVQYLMTDGSIIKGMISFCCIGRFKKWSASDVNYLTILGRVISSILKKQAFI